MVSVLLWVWIGRRQMGFERVEVLSPEAAVGRQPRVQLRKALRSQRVDAPLGVDPHIDESDFSEHTQMPGDGRLRQRRQSCHQLAGRSLAVSEEIEHDPTARLGDRTKDIHNRSMINLLYDVKII
jgi:hypothetical protein